MTTLLRARRHVSAGQHRQAGSAMVELALLSPVLVVLALGVADFCRVFYTSVEVTNAAYAAASYAAHNTAYTNVAGIQAAGNQDAPNLVANQYNPSGLTFIPNSTTGNYFYCQCPGSTAQVTCPPAPVCSGGNSPKVYVDVETRYSFHTLVTYPGVPAQTTLTGHAQIRYR